MLKNSSMYYHRASHPLTNIISIHTITVSLLMVTAVFGYVVSYEKLYAFHLVLATYWVLIFTANIPIKKQAIKALVAPLLFLVFMCLSLLWAPNIKNGLFFIFYFLCGYTIVFSLVNFANDMHRLNLIFNTLAFFFALNIFVGLLETTGYFRLPVSPYYGLEHTRPSGFNSNINNFGFVFIVIFPFLVLHPSRFVRVIGTLIALWFTFKLESKGFFLGLFLYVCLYFIFQIKKKTTWLWMLLGVLSGLFFVLLLVVNSIEINLTNRSFTAFEQVGRAVDLVKTGDIVAQDSTSIRAAMYITGVQELVNTYGLGLGVAGISSKLASESNFFGDDKDIFSFHNFFLEMLVDLGIIPFIFIMFFYIKLALSNIQASKKVKNKKLSYFNKASGLSLLTIIPASISPSSIIYVFTFWLVIGFSITAYLVARNHIKYAS